MDNKQIIIDGVNIKDCKRRIGKDNYCRYYKRPCSENNFNCIWEKYLRKEQECEEFKKQVEVFTRQLEKANKEVITEKEKNATQRQENEKLEQVVTEIKPILELYANSKVGEEQLDGTYKITVKESKVLGDTYITFDPRPAKQALQKIREVKND